ncbi:MAG: hypothetical protein D6678_01435 [Zetaproteobacteria bacterium]|nr:MAG: hypothetical protein D6678_01435 [Zetaproteobacteria bacterium]
MRRAFRLLDRFRLHLLSLLVAIGLWMYVHGEGQGSLTIEAPLQVQGLPVGMMIVNDLPDRVRITLSGLQSRLQEVRARGLFIPLDVADITSPGVVRRALSLSAIHVPPGLKVEKIRPDTLELQVDRKIRRKVPVRPVIELPAGWQARDVSVTPEKIALTGPEVWLGSLPAVRSNPVRPRHKVGPFVAKVTVATPSGQGIRLVDPGATLTVRGTLARVALPASTRQKEE